MKLLYFGAEWCSSCKALKTIVEKEAPIKNYEFKYVDMDSDEGAIMAEDFNIRSLPTLILVDKQGNEVKRAVGNTAWKEIQL